ncbi:MAG: endonuclease/exonuclease/phosphatase family protein [Anaerolineaceae bacterium]|nr:endonuclease/exonuclease/phosphatase family protein [Anaerolineaceae bacterium]
MTSLFRRITTIATGLYSLGAVVYLLLRLIFGDGFWWLSLVNTFAYLVFAPLLVLIPASLLARSRLAAFRLTPFAAIALLWFGPYYWPKPVTISTSTPLHVLTLNVWGNNHHLEGIESWVRSTDADLVLLQEISPAYANDGLANLRDRYPYQSIQPDPSRWGGNFTLSRYPILEESYVDLHTPGTPAPLRLVLDVGGQRVAVYNVHLAFPVGEQHVNLPFPIDSFYMRVMLGFDDRVRNQQIAELTTYLKTEPYPFIVAGDFNTSDQSATYGRLARVMRDSFREAGRGLGGSWPVSTARGLPAFLPPLIRIDYIWHSADFQTVAAWQDAPVGSDHLPLHALLTLRDAG